MIYLTELFGAFFTALMLENVLFARAIDIPELYEKRTPKEIFTVGTVLTIVICVCAVPSYFLSGLFNRHSFFVPYMTLGFLLLNFVVFLVFYYLTSKIKSDFWEGIKDSLPFYSVNCVTLSSLLIAARLSSSTKFFSFFGYCLGSGLGFTAALFVIWSIRQTLSLSRTPRIFRGLPITLIYIGIVSLALFGLLGNQLPS